MVLGQLRSMGYQMIRVRVCKALRPVDPVNVALRWHGGSKPEEFIVCQHPVCYDILVSYITSRSETIMNLWLE